MAAHHLQRDQYKLKTTFLDGCTIHTIQTPTTGEDGPAVETRIKWRHKKDIGNGGFGVVWLEEADNEGQERRGGSLRAVKRMPQKVKGFNWSRELDIMARLRDDSSRSLFVQFLGWYEDEAKGYVFFAMEYIEHGDLSQYLNTSGTSAKSQAKNIVTQILKGLVILHTQNICHRDIKPKNILISSISPFRIKIADFGLSKHQNNTSLRTSCGSLFYLAPELQGFSLRNSSGSYTNLVDIRSLGVLTHVILTRDLPFLLRDAPTFDSDIDSGVEVRQGQREVLVMDMNRFSKYCCGDITFPDAALRGANISNDGIEFVKSLLVTNPRSRISAAEALNSAWILNEAEEPYPSSPNTEGVLFQSPVGLDGIESSSPTMNSTASSTSEPSDTPTAAALGAPPNDTQLRVIINANQRLYIQEHSTIRRILSILPNSVLSRSHNAKGATVSANYGTRFEILSPGVNPNVDIIAIHGLYCAGDRTWVADNGVNWLKDLLPRDYPSARILNYCNQNYMLSDDGLGVADLALRIISDVSILRRSTESERRPIVFLVHGVGGIFLKYALVHANSCSKSHLVEHKHVHLSTYGIMFFGTPHQGQTVVPLKGSTIDSTLVSNKIRLIRQLHPYSNFLGHLAIQYDIIADQFHTICFYETEKTPTHSGSVKVISKSSATIAGTPSSARYREIPLKKNHLEIVRVDSRKDTFYMEVVCILQMMGRNATEYISGRWMMYEGMEDV